MSFPSPTISGESGCKFPTKLEKIPLSKNPQGTNAVGEGEGRNQHDLREGNILVSWPGRAGWELSPLTQALFHTSWVCAGFEEKLILNSQLIVHYNWKYGDASEKMLILESECQPSLLISEIHTSLSALKLLLDWNFYKLNSKSNITELPNVTELLIKGI